MSWWQWAKETSKCEPKKYPTAPIKPPNRKWAKTKTHIERPWIGVPNWFWWLVLWTLEKIPSLWSTELSPSQNIMFYQWRPKDMGWHTVNLWSLGVVSSRKDRTNGKRPHLNPPKEGVSKSLCLPDQPEVLWEGNCGKTWSETAEFVTIALVFKQWILQSLGPASIFGWINVVWSRMWHTSMPPTLEEASQGALPCKPQKETSWCVKTPVFQRRFLNVHIFIWLSTSKKDNHGSFFVKSLRSWGRYHQKNSPSLEPKPINPKWLKVKMHPTRKKD